MIDQALSYARLHWRVIPLHWITEAGCSCGDPKCASPGKHPLTKTGVHEASSDPDQIKSWWYQWPEANIGIATGSVSGVVVIDFDNKRGGLEKREDLIDEFSELAETLISSTGFGFHHFFRYPDHCRVGCRNKIGGFGVDVRGDGGYVVAPSSKHFSGAVYEWEDTEEPTRQELKSLSAKLLEYIGEGREQQSIQTIEADVAFTDHQQKKIESALQYIKPLGDDWLHCGMAIHNATGGSYRGFEIWDRWAKTIKKYESVDPKVHLTRWLSFKNSKLNVRTEASIYDLAKKGGWLWAEPGEKFIIDIDLDSPGETIQPGKFKCGSFAIDVYPPEDIPPIYSIDQIESLEKQDKEFESYWRDFVLFRGGVFLVAGPPKVGKSSLFLELAMQAACGGDFLGYPFNKPIKTAWIQAEIHPHFLNQRISSAMQGFNAKQRTLIRQNFFATPRLDLSITDDRHFMQMANMIRSIDADLVCIDPIINFSDANENDNSEVRRMLRRVCALIEAVPKQTAIAILHHTKKPSKYGNEDPFDLIRGAGAFRGVYDTGIVLTKEKKSDLIKIAYECRNGPSPIGHGLKHDPNTNVWEAVDLDVQEQEDGTYKAAIKDDLNGAASREDFIKAQAISKIISEGKIKQKDLFEYLAENFQGGGSRRLQLAIKDRLLEHQNGANNPPIRVEVGVRNSVIYHSILRGNA